ncbi:hypothetical protein [Paraburkholderia acidipaludis]|uniref:hypothetical protein n=1 Tax=Paraburkholderia acidipaludis TaxID=660537 RepID=UPI0012ECA1A2|nr:hypothetical protein [Paraburkholderia acidipaludis]
MYFNGGFYKRASVLRDSFALPMQICCAALTAVCILTPVYRGKRARHLLEYPGQAFAEHGAATQEGNTYGVFLRVSAALRVASPKKKARTRRGRPGFSAASQLFGTA